MNIGILIPISHDVSGGSFSFQHAILDAIDSIQLNPTNRIIFVSNLDLSHREDYRKMDTLRFSRFFLGRFARLSARLILAFRYIFRREFFDKARIPGYFLSRYLKKNSIDVIWSIEPLAFPLEVPYVTTHWDLGHRVLPMFPETSTDNGEWRKREQRNADVLPRAALVVIGTQKGFQEIKDAYGIDERNGLIAPMPSRYGLDSRIEPRNKGQFIYPAQFWAHKNHITLLHAFAQARLDLNEDIRLILPGVDKGNKDLILRHIQELDIQDSVEIPGFISIDQLLHLYRTSRMLLFPTLLGPDNLPPLEAMAHRCPVAVSDILGAREQFGDSALYFSPHSVDELCKVIVNAYLDEEMNKVEVENGIKLVSSRTAQQYVSVVLGSIQNLETSIWNISK
jgi:glycosyltransferase involved in cell wall biosynthesis